MKIEVRDHGPDIAIVTIDNQAKRNAMSRAMLADLAALWDQLETSRHRCIVLTGAGDKAFTSGADLGGDLSADGEQARIINRGLLKTSSFAKPIIAAVNGDCVAGGLELLLSTDIRIAAPHARFGLPEVRWSIYPFGGATAKLNRQIGHVHAMDLLLTGRLIDAEEARRLNLVNRVVAADAVLAEALSVAEMIAANSPTAVQAVRRAVSTAIAEQALGQEPLEQKLGEAVRASEHFREGVAAFLEKRTPVYR